jgi:TIR domain
MDVAAIEPGKDFRKAIDQSVANCSVLLALIGRDWLDSKDPQGNRRLDNPNDFVRAELASALRRDIPVVPVLVRGARMPNAEQLPDDLKDLHYRNAVELTHARWKSDVQLLVRALHPYMDEPKADALPEQSDAATDRSQVLRRVSMPVTGAATDNTSAAMQRFEARTIERISRELAAYIGPISELIVKKAAKRSSSVEDLCGRVAKEIATEAERTKFLKACRF